jgi:uncharacterized protein
MSQRCIVSDPFRFAAEGRKISGTVPLLRLNRLADILFRSEGEVTYALSGNVGVDGKAFLRLEASGVLALQCQRCLSGLDWPLELESILHLVTPGTPIPDEELEIESFETIEAVADMDLPCRSFRDMKIVRRRTLRVGRTRNRLLLHSQGCEGTAGHIRHQTVPGAFSWPSSKTRSPRPSVACTALMIF